MPCYPVDRSASGTGTERPVRLWHPNHMNRTAEAVWYGALATGHGVISTQSGVLKESNYSFKTRFEGDPGTNPEELIAAAHAGCFSMALSMVLNQAGMTAEKIDTKAVVTIDKVEGGFGITKSALD